MLEFSNIVAVVLGNILGGQIYDAAGPIPVMVIAPCSFAAAIVYTLVFVKETKPRVEGQSCSNMMRDLVTVDNIKQSYKTCSMKRPGNIRLQIWLLVWTSCSQRFCDMGTLAIAYPYTLGMYKWKVTEFSHANTAFYVVNAFATVVIVPILANKLRLHEAALGLIGMLSLTSKMILTSVAIRPPFFYYAWMCGVLNNAAGIAIRSRLSKLVNKDELGRAFSLLATCESVTPLLGTLAFVQIYNSSLNLFPGLAFACAAVFLVPCIFIFGWMMHLPTVSLGDYERDGRTSENQLETFSSSYVTLKEEKF